MLRVPGCHGRVVVEIQSGRQMSRVTARKRVLGTAELLEEIFSHADQPSKSSSARVCKTWSDLALKSLWCHIKDVEVLFSLLAPIEHSTNKHYVSYFFHHNAAKIFVTMLLFRCSPGASPMTIGGLLTDTLNMYMSFGILEKYQKSASYSSYIRRLLELVPSHVYFQIFVDFTFAIVTIIHCRTPSCFSMRI